MDWWSHECEYATVYVPNQQGSQIEPSSLESSTLYREYSVIWDTAPRRTVETLYKPLSGLVALFYILKQVRIRCDSYYYYCY